MQRLFRTAGCSNYFNACQQQKEALVYLHTRQKKEEELRQTESSNQSDPRSRKHQPTGLSVFVDMMLGVG